jgi:hypothetical protein
VRIDELTGADSSFNQQRHGAARQNASTISRRSELWQNDDVSGFGETALPGRISDWWDRRSCRLLSYRRRTRCWRIARTSARRPRRPVLPPGVPLQTRHIRDAIKKVSRAAIFVYGSPTRKVGGLDLQKPDGIVGLSRGPSQEPAGMFSEPTGLSGGSALECHKFVVIDFDK